MRRAAHGLVVAALVLALFVLLPVGGVEGCSYGTDYGVCRSEIVTPAGLHLPSEVATIEVVLVLLALPAYAGWRLDRRAAGRRSEPSPD